MITIITDASFDGESGRVFAGWAAWARCDDGREPRTWAGPITRLECRDPGDAEIAALLYGFIAATRHFPPQRVLAQSDCLRALCILQQELGFGESPHADGLSIKGHFGKRGSPLTRVERLVVEAWRVRLADVPCRVTLRHVKGHTPVTGSTQQGRYWVNRYVDKLAVAEMRKLRKAAFAVTGRETCASV